MKKLSSVMLGLMLSAKSMAGFFPFPDPTDSLMKYKEILILVQQLNEMKSQGEKFTHQINGIVNVKNTINTKIDESKLLMSGDFKFAARHYVPGLDRWGRQFSSWDKLIKKNTGRFAKVNHSNINSDEQDEAPSRFKALTMTTKASDAVATQTYNDVDNEIEVLEKLKNDMSEATTQKAITELVARINIQKAIIQAKSNRLSAVQTKLATADAEQKLREAKWAENFLR